MCPKFWVATCSALHNELITHSLFSDPMEYLPTKSQLYYFARLFIKNQSRYRIKIKVRSSYKVRVLL